MITSPAFAGKTYGVYGLARSGKATVAALAASGATVWAWDDSDDTRRAFGRHIRYPDISLMQTLDAFVVSPGVPLRSNGLASDAFAHDVPTIGDIELFAQARASLPPHKVVGITGTNGKSTTTALVHHLLVAAGRPALMAGNIGLPILAQDPLPAGGTYVLELSSYQLDITHSLDCDVAVLLNLTPDHLERHGDMADYAAAKARLFEMQGRGGVAIVNAAADAAWSFTAGSPASVRNIESVDLVGQAEWPALQGPHNFENARAAVAVAAALGLTAAEIAAGLASYPGLAHRMEPIATIAGVRWINDSKATNPDSTAPALAAYPDTHWIAGGRPKLDAHGRPDLSALLPHLGQVCAAYLIGEAAPAFAAALAPHLPVMLSGTLDAAVRAATAAARPGETVLLSPACASFDQFRDFEARGDAFRALVMAMATAA
jgi:UDP-N-acetylmuramoylalanine--D-glutamate ligase